MSNKSLREVRLEAVEKYNTGSNTYDDFNIGDNVKIITPCQDFYFFNGETGKVIKNSHKYLSIRVEFDEPRHFEDGYIQKDFGFNPEDLCKLSNLPKTNNFHRVVERNYPY